MEEKLVVEEVLGIFGLLKAPIMVPETLEEELFIVGPELSKFISVDIIFRLLYLGLDNFGPIRKGNFFICEDVAGKLATLVGVCGHPST